jgi:hypothetical protein
MKKKKIVSVSLKQIWIKGPNLRPKALKQVQERAGKALEFIGLYR